MYADIETKERPISVWPGGSRFYTPLKRVIDVVATLGILLFTAPIWALATIALKLDSRGPVIFRQSRIGLHGKEFVMLKFRSMVENADSKPHQEAFAKYAQGEALDHDEHAPLFKKASDPRITRVGKILRATNLDELPQLINVLKGEMSLVGPRPAIRYELQWYKQWYHDRYQVLPGITGLWQLKARHRVDLEDMVILDLRYITKRSLLLDLWLILISVPGIFIQPKGDGAGGRRGI